MVCCLHMDSFSFGILVTSCQIHWNQNYLVHTFAEGCSGVGGGNVCCGYTPLK